MTLRSMHVLTRKWNPLLTLFESSLRTFPWSLGLKICQSINQERKLVATENLKLPTGKEIQELEMKEAYKYLGIQQADSIKINK